MEQARRKFLLHHTQRFFDMLVDIRVNIKLLPISVIFFWVEGHQLHKYSQQSYVGELNDKGDKMANKY